MNVFFSQSPWNYPDNGSRIKAGPEAWGGSYMVKMVGVLEVSFRV